MVPAMFRMNLSVALLTWRHKSERCHRIKNSLRWRVKAWFAENPQGNDPRYYMRVVWMR